MHFEAKRLLTGLLDSYFKYKLEHISLQGGSAALLMGLDATLENLDFLTQLPNDQPYKPQYEQLFLTQAEGWEPLWNGVENEIEKHTGKGVGDGHIMDTFSKARHDFLEALHVLRKGHISDSQTAFESSRTSIEELIQLAFSHADLKDNIQQLLILYELVLVQEPLQERGLEVVAKIQKHLEPLIDSQGPASLKPLYMAAMHDLDTGRQAVGSLQLLQGRMFVLAAHDAVKMIAQQIGRKKEGPIDILEQAIQLESLALQLNVLKQSSEGREPPLEESNSLLQRLQQRVVPFVEKFFSAAVARQIQEFRAAPSGSGPDLRCQNSPWDMVIPLIVQGKRDAENAKTVLANDISLLDKAADWQMLAIKKWQEALKNLKAPQKPRKEEKQQDNKQQKEEKKQKDQERDKDKQPSSSGSGAEEKTVAGKADLNSVLRLLQEMENDDRSKPKVAPKSERQGESARNRSEQRPW
jgi:hypothetical protein